MRLLGAVLLLASLACEKPRPREAGTRAAATLPVVEWAFRGFPGDGWVEQGLAKRTDSTLQLSPNNPWSLSKAGLKGPFKGLAFKFRAPIRLGDFLELRLESRKAVVFPRVKIEPRHRLDLDEGWNEVFVPMAELNPASSEFDRLVLRAVRDLDASIELDEVGFVGTRASEGGSVAQAQVRVDCSVEEPISPWVYGVTHDFKVPDTKAFAVAPTVRRWGGPGASRYNWELGNVWNEGAAGAFQNVAPGGPNELLFESFLEANAGLGIESALTLPMLGWVARDGSSSSFPPGVKAAGEPALPPPTLTSVAAPPEFVGRWVTRLGERDGQKHRARPLLYLLDHEPLAWHEVHRDLRARPVELDELLDRTERYGTAVKEADAEGRLAGPCERWERLAVSGPDGREQGASYVAGVEARERKVGKALVDVLDLRYLPEGLDGPETPELALRRVEATRGLFDPGFRDEKTGLSPKLVPRMKEWASAGKRRRLLMVGEYAFGGEGEQSGGVALAEALGRLGELGVFAAFHRGVPGPGTPAFFAFRAFRNYDGRGAQFPSRAVKVERPQGLSVFGAVDRRGRLVLVALNLRADQTFSTGFELADSCGRGRARRVFQFAGPRQGIAELKQGTDVLAPVLLPSMSITVVELSLAR